MDKKEYISLSPSQSLEKLGVTDQGLSDEEAQKRLVQYGENTLRKGSNTALNIFIKQFRSSLIYLFIIAAAISFFLNDFTDGVVITVILLLNAILGFFQEYRSERSIEKLSKFISKQVLVIRNGKIELIEEKFLTIGDIVKLREGDIVPADIKLIQAEDFNVNESQLSGESVSIDKKPGDDEKSLVFAGSVIEEGEGIGAVYAIGNNTALGSIARLSSNTKKVTQYEKSLQDFSNFLMRIILITLAVIFFGKLLITHDISQISALFLFVVALAVTVIPEALPVIAIVTLSEGALKLARRSVVVKRLSSLEDLGNVNLLCTDKTGTLTENKLRIRDVVSDEKDLFLKFVYASIENLGLRKKKFESPYDLAFQEYIPQQIKDQVKEWKQIADLPFDPKARRRRVLIENKIGDKHYLVEVGSVETLLNISSTHKKDEYIKRIIEDGKEGIRHLGIAFKEVSQVDNFDILKNEDGLKFLGYAQMIDPLRPTAKHTIELAEKLGIDIKILTGDSKEVAEYVGKQIGLLKDDQTVYSGDEIEKMTEFQLKNAVEACAVFARVTPEQKYQIIKLLKEKHVVGYQGDGINDAPSLKLADVAVAVNSATDVAKESSDIVLLKNDLEVIINGIHYGRNIFVNINKYIKHTMVGNFGSFFSLAILYLVSADLPLLPIQLLLGNLIQDIPLITIYSDNVDLSEVKKPQKYDIHSIMFISLFLGSFSAIFDFVYFRFVGFSSNPQTQTSLFLFLTFTQLVVILSVRNRLHMWQGRSPSALVIGSILIFSLFSLFITYFVPLGHIFSFIPLPASSIGVIVLATLIYVMILDYIKVVYFKVIQK